MAASVSLDMQAILNPSIIPVSESHIYSGSQAAVISELDDIDALVAAYWAKVLRFVSFSVNDADLAQTITQDCFLKAFNARASFRGESSVSTWLLSIANNLIRDHMRRKKIQFWRKAAQTSLDVTEMASYLPSEETSIERQLIQKERTEAVRAAMDGLSVNQRRVFLMRFFEGMDISEISEQLGMPVNTVKTHLHRATQAIRGRLGSTQ